MAVETCQNAWKFLDGGGTRRGPDDPRARRAPEPERTEARARRPRLLERPVAETPLWAEPCGTRWDDGRSQRGRRWLRHPPTLGLWRRDRLAASAPEVRRPSPGLASRFLDGPGAC